MRMTHLIGKRYKEKPAETSLKSHEFLLRGGYARQVSSGIYSLLPPAVRIVDKIKTIIRDEMDRIGGQEILMPLVLPRELWDESGRYSSVGNELVRFKDRTQHDMVLAMTHEEAVIHLSRSEITSYRQLPYMVYQIQTKFRDEPRSRGGLIRVREFTMKDAYSFHTSQADLEDYYLKCWGAYVRIFARAGIPETVVVASDTGMMGGSVAHEFMLLCDAGEDTIVACTNCSYIANSEIATSKVKEHHEELLPLKKIDTPNCSQIDQLVKLLKIPGSKILKAVVYYVGDSDTIVLTLIRGDLEINEVKLSKILLSVPQPAKSEHITILGSVPGYVSPIGINRDCCKIIVDHSVASANNLVCGANEGGKHFLNFNLLRDLPDAKTVDIAIAQPEDICIECGSPLKTSRGIEVGNIFQLSTKYSKAMAMRYLDENGTEQIPIMGCYGIGVGRLMSSIMEALHDQNGPIWPMSISPWQVHLIALQADNAEVRAVAQKIYDDLQSMSIEVLLDDRDERPGVKFAEADLLGIPLRINVSNRHLPSGLVEFQYRGIERDASLVAIDQAPSQAKSIINKALREIEEQAERSAEKQIHKG